MKVSPSADEEDLRFGFGENWKRYLTGLNEQRIAAAESSLRELLGVETLRGRTFLDVGSGSGLFSLAAARLGAKRVHSFDYDLSSVACTREVSERFGPDDVSWTVERASVLDRQYLQSLGTWDVVYSWGVLHHTGSMLEAFANVARAVRSGGQLALAIYNDQGRKSRVWWWIKRFYNTNLVGRMFVLGVFIPYAVAGALFADLMRLRNPAARYLSHVRGMSHVDDWVDWLGGFPFEVASRATVSSYFTDNGFELQRLQGCGNKHGCNEFVFRKC